MSGVGGGFEAWMGSIVRRGRQRGFLTVSEIMADLDELGEFVLDGVAERRYIIARDLDETEELLRRRAEAIGRAEMPPGHDLGG